jgi:arginyl-tRNA synthetase
LGALKFFLLRVDPKKKMIFNPEESIDFHGFTGPFIQYTHARIKSILRKTGTTVQQVGNSMLPLEKALAMQLAHFSAEVNEAAEALDPSKLAIYAFNLAKLFNSFYAELSIANAESEEKKNLRIQLGILTAATLKQAMQTLGIEVPEQM